ncbi:MAG: peptidoglycan DD-metalloendopeptidase family protein [Eubacteriales bacterium]|nr:peptidoglycan DD-metalloendopeptidase family protein [Clostridiales bacterium]MDY5836252.1 peptidoglycan DD-metalloendopeptidase family protein [Eubacteriales bacterium]
MRKKFLKQFLSLLSGVLATCLLLLLCLPAQGVVAFDSQAELDRLMAEQADLESQWESAKEELALFKSQQDLADTDLSWLLERSEEQQALYEKQVEQVASITRIKQSLERSLEVAIRQYESHKALYFARIEGMYSLQKKSQLEILLESDSLESYFTTLRFMKMISDADEQDLARMREQRDKLQEQKAQTEKQLEEYNRLLQSIKEDKSAIEQDLADYQFNMANLDAQMQNLADSIEGFSNDHFQLQMEIDEANRRLAEEEYLASLGEQAESEATPPQQAPPSVGNSYSGNGFCWPCPQTDGVTSEFGPRSIPEMGINDFHTGIDFAADYGAPAVAAAPGTVIYASWMEYGGNTVQIDIGGGIMTMYCHLNEIYVSVGQTVNAGDVVGAIGSTGLANGPHLHFEIQVGGSPVDPRLYLY